MNKHSHHNELLTLLVITAIGFGNAFMLGPGECEYLTNYLDTHCVPIGSGVCATFDLTEAVLTHKCVKDPLKSDCAGNFSIALSRLSNCNECDNGYWCKSDNLCTDEPTVCGEEGFVERCPATRCSERGTFRHSEEGKNKTTTCTCRPGFGGETCDRCSKEPAAKRTYICCKVNLFGSEWAILAPRNYQVQDFMSGKYKDAKACSLRNATINGTAFECDCQRTPTKETTDPIWLSDLISSGNEFKRPSRIKAEANDAGTEDSIEGVIAFSIAIAIVAIILTICLYACCVTLIRNPSAMMPQSTTITTTIPRESIRDVSNRITPIINGTRVKRRDKKTALNDNNELSLNL